MPSIIIPILTYCTIFFKHDQLRKLTLTGYFGRWGNKETAAIVHPDNVAASEEEPLNRPLTHRGAGRRLVYRLCGCSALTGSWDKKLRVVSSASQSERTDSVNTRVRAGWEGFSVRVTGRLSNLKSQQPISLFHLTELLRLALNYSWMSARLVEGRRHTCMT